MTNIIQTGNTNRYGLKADRKHLEHGNANKKFLASVT